MFVHLILILSLIFSCSLEAYAFLWTTSFYTAVINGIDCGCYRVSDLDVSKIRVHLYNFETNSNASYSINNAGTQILNRTDFNPNQCIQIVVPGFNSPNTDSTSVTSRCIFSKLRCEGLKPLTLFFDHSAYTNSANPLQYLNIIGTYKKAVWYAKSIGVKIGDVLVHLLGQVDRNKIDIIGHSLGGQIVGYVGETVINRTNVPLKRIYGSDPAGACYADCPNEHLKSNNAELVVTFHCNAGELGSKLNLADYDFYSGNGVNQRNCNGGSSPGLFLRAAASLCSHDKCVQILENPALRSGIWKAVKCSSTARYLNNECNDNESSLAGYRVTPTNSSGVYYFTPDSDLECDISS